MFFYFGSFLFHDTLMEPGFSGSQEECGMDRLHLGFTDPGCPVRDDETPSTKSSHKFLGEGSDSLVTEKDRDYTVRNPRTLV